MLIRVYILEFSIQLCELLPLSPSLWFKSPSLPCLYKYTEPVFLNVYGGQESIQRCKGYGFWASGRLTSAAKSLSRSIFKMRTFCIALFESYLSTDRTKKKKYRPTRIFRTSKSEGIVLTRYFFPRSILLQ